MERADYFFAQDRAGRCRQELRNSSRTTGRFTARDPGSRERHSCTFGKPKRRGRSHEIQTQKIGGSPSSIAKAAARFVVRSVALVARTSVAQPLPVLV